MKQPPRSLLIYTIIVLLAGVVCFGLARSWRGSGDEERRLKRNQEKHQTINVQSYVAVYGPKALLINSGLCLLLLAAGPWAMRSMQHPPAPGPAGTSQHLPLVIVALTLVASALNTLPRLQHSLWADEATTMRKFAVGEYSRQATGKMEFKPVTPLYRQFALKTPNNHMLYSTISGMIHKAFFKQSADPMAPYFSEALLRLPAFAAGMAALLAVWWLAREMGLKQFSWLPVVLMALHPWHLQYTAEARGYSMIMALVPTSFALLLTALRSGKWRWWLLYSLSQVIMVDTWPLAVNLVLLTNLAGAALILGIYWRTSDCLTQLARWGVASLIGAMISLQLLLPTVPQVLVYIQDAGHLKVTPAHFLEGITALLTGSRWSNWLPENELITSWQARVAAHPVLAGGFLIILILLWLLGIVAVWRQGGARRWMGILWVLLPVSIFLQLYLKQNIFLPWYWVPALPGSVLLMAFGVQAAAQRAGRAGILLVTGLPAVVAAGLLPQHSHLRAAPLQRNREAALLTRRVINPTHPDYGGDALTAYVGRFYQGYDSSAEQLENLIQLRNLMQLAQSKNLPLFVNLCRPQRTEPTIQDILNLLDNPARFRKSPPLYGTDFESTRWVYEFIQK